jgi:hypothetical protein
MSFTKPGNRNRKQKRAISKEAPGPVWGPISQSVDEGCEGIPEDEPARSLHFFRGALSAKLRRGSRAVDNNKTSCLSSVLERGVF